MNNTSLILIIVGTALVNNVVLNQFLGICSFLGVSKQMKASISLGGAVIFVITIASAVASLLYDYVLAPLGMDFMKTIIFILVIAALVQIVEMFLKKTSPAIYKAVRDERLRHGGRLHHRHRAAGGYPVADQREGSAGPPARSAHRHDRRGADVHCVYGLWRPGAVRGGAAG